MININSRIRKMPVLKKLSPTRLSTLDQYSIGIATTTLFFSLCIYLTNKLFFKFNGIEYIPFKQILLSYFYLLLINVGMYFAMRPDNWLQGFIRRFNLVYIVVGITVTYTSAIQLTPFPIIDKYLLSADQWFFVDMGEVLKLVHSHYYFQLSLTYAYQLLTPELFATLLLAALFADKKSQSELFFLLLSGTFIGFTFYYFFPSTAPATLIDSPHFLPEQHQTHIKFDLIHSGLPSPINFEGGLIAMPSYHCIWILICQYYLMRWKWLGYLILPFNAWLIASCFLLGWHYFVDILISITIVLSLLHLTKKTST